MNFAMNADSWEDLTQEQRDIFMSEMSQNVADIMWAYVADGEAGMDWLRENGGTVAPADDAFVAAWDEVQANAVADTIAQGQEDGIENAEEIVMTFMGLVEKWTEIVAEVGQDKDAYRDALEAEIFSKL